MKLLSFEIKKIDLRKKVLFLSAIILLCIASLFVRNLSMQTFIKNEEYETIESNLQAVYQNIEYHKIRLTTNPDNKKDSELLALSSLMKETLFELRSASVSNDWQVQLKTEISFWTQVKDYQEKDGHFPITDTELNRLLFLQEELLEKNIPPQHEKYSIALPNFVKQVIDFYANIGIYIIMLFLIGGILTREFEQHSVKSLFTQPVKRSSMLFINFFVPILLYVVMTGIVLSMAIGIGFFIGNVGTFDYPVVIQLTNEIQSISITQYVLYTLFVTTATIFLGVSLCLLYSLLFRNTMITILGLLVTFVGGFVFTNSIASISTSMFNPFRTLIAKNVILNQGVILWYQGMPIVLFCALIIYFVALRKIKTIKII